MIDRDDGEASLLSFEQVFQQNAANFGDGLRMAMNFAVAGSDNFFAGCIFAMSTAIRDDAVTPVRLGRSTLDPDDVVMFDFVRNLCVPDQSEHTRIFCERIHAGARGGKAFPPASVILFKDHPTELISFCRKPDKRTTHPLRETI